MDTKQRIIDWNHIYLLGRYGPDGMPHLTTEVVPEIWIGC
jgi:hypothetical protein